MKVLFGAVMALVLFGGVWFGLAAILFYAGTGLLHLFGAGVIPALALAIGKVICALVTFALAANISIGIASLFGIAVSGH